MLDALIAFVVAVTLVVAPPTAFAGPVVESAPAVEIVEDHDPEVDALVAAAPAAPIDPARRLDGANAPAPAIACPLPPPVPPPERQP